MHHGQVAPTHICKPTCAVIPAQAEIYAWAWTMRILAMQAWAVRVLATVSHMPPWIPACAAMAAVRHNFDRMNGTQCGKGIARMKKSLPNPITYRLIFAQNVRQVRRLKEITQEELAYLAGVSRIYIGEVERGGRNVTIDVMGRIANALDTPLEQLLVRDLTKIG